MSEQTAIRLARAETLAEARFGEIVALTEDRNRLYDALEALHTFATAKLPQREFDDMMNDAFDALAKSNRGRK